MNTTATRIKTLSIDGMQVEIDNERNVLELVRKANIDLPTFCYHSQLSVYGACRLCLVEIQGRGIQGACSTPPEAGMVIRTATAELRDIRKIAIELLLANHDQSCPTCVKSASCQLQELARRLGVSEVRFKHVQQRQALDESSPSIVRDPNKCVLCGDCVRFCSEVQGIGAIDFAYRGHQAAVVPAFGKLLGEVECVNCGQCAAICPTGALSVRSQIEQVWTALSDKKKLVVAQIAPAVRVAIGEALGLANGDVPAGKIVAALKRLGFDLVYDTSFSADLTVIEEANEFIKRKTLGKNLPQFTSCCPAWVKFAEQYFPDLLGNLSTCRSPQQMLGSLCKATLPAEKAVRPEDVVVVSIMPCAAKKFEAQRPEFSKDGAPDVDYVLTTDELARMIRQAGCNLELMDSASFDMPMGFKTGAGVIFGNSGGVAEAVLRYAAEKLSGTPLANPDFKQVRGQEGVRLVNLQIAGHELKLAVVHGLKNARDVAQRVRSGELQVDLVEVMACPGGCIGGAGQPISLKPDIRQRRTKALYEVDKNLELHKSQDNHYVSECYRNCLGEVNGPKAHDLLHTHYQSRRRIIDLDLNLSEAPSPKMLQVSVCVGTSCFVRGSQNVLQQLLSYVRDNDLEQKVQVAASFCFENCRHGPTVVIAEQRISQCTVAQATELIDKELAKR